MNKHKRKLRRALSEIESTLGITPPMKKMRVSDRVERITIEIGNLENTITNLKQSKHD